MNSPAIEPEGTGATRGRAGRGRLHRVPRRRTSRCDRRSDSADAPPTATVAVPTPARPSNARLVKIGRARATTKPSTRRWAAMVRSSRGGPSAHGTRSHRGTPNEPAAIDRATKRSAGTGGVGGRRGNAQQIVSTRARRGSHSHRSGLRWTKVLRRGVSWPCHGSRAHPHDDRVRHATQSGTHKIEGDVHVGTMAADVARVPGSTSPQSAADIKTALRMVLARVRRDIERRTHR
jgi:hypothetical protein